MAGGRGQVVACVDGSSHTAAVCDQAAWLAERLDCGVTLLNVAEPPALTADGVLNSAASRVEHMGGELVSLLTRSGEFRDAAVDASSRSQAIVIGRRGRTSPPHSARFGQNARRLIGSAPSPLLLAGPRPGTVRRVIALFNPRAPDAALTRLLAIHPALDGADCILQGYGAAGRGGGLSTSEALIEGLRRSPCDLLVLPRHALLADPRRREVEGLLTYLGLPVLLPGL